MKRLVSKLINPFVFLYGSIILIATFTTWALKAQTKPEDKQYTVSKTIPEWEKIISSLQWISTQIKNSDMPSRNSVYATDSIITPLVQQIFYQINAQVKYEQNLKNPIKDTTKPKKN